ncbi:MAG: hypothetical protein ACLR23_15790 [Clostridia bacterium]
MPTLRKALKAARASDFVGGHSKLDSQVDGRWTEIFLEEAKARLNIARALVKNAPLLIP